MPQQEAAGKSVEKLLGRHYATGEPVEIFLEADRVARVEPVTADRDTQQWPWIAPALIDLQVNGYGGQEFSSPDLTVQKVEKIARKMDTFGVTRTLPTVTTNEQAVLLHAVKTIDAACRQDAGVAHRFPGIHLEGPFVSAEDGPRGAHPLAYVCPPSWDKFQALQEAAGGRIRIVTVSPEYDQTPEFIRRAADSGVVVSIGHTAATPEQIRAAVDAGARMSTHLGNGAHAMIHRHHNYIWSQLADDRLTAGIITDGHHLPPEVVKTFVRAKTIERTVLVSDISGLTGLPPGRYESELCALEILPSGKLVVAGQRELLAGASRTLGWCVAVATRYAEVSLADAIRMAVFNPAALVEVEPGGLEPADLADLVLFRMKEPVNPDDPDSFEVIGTILSGQMVFGQGEVQ